MPKNAHVPDIRFANQMYRNMQNNASPSESNPTRQGASTEANAPITQDVTPGKLCLVPMLYMNSSDLRLRENV